MSDQTEALHDALAFRGTMEDIEALLAAGADVNRRNSSGWTALQTAAYYGHRLPGIIERILDAGADPTIATFHGHQTALDLAVQRSNIDMVTTFIKRGFDMTHALRWVTLGTLDGLENNPVVPLLLNAGADVNARVEVSKESDDLSTHPFDPVLHRALWNWETLDDARFLISIGANPNILSNDGEPPLHMAARWGCAETTKALLEAGADVHAVYKGHTALAEAAFAHDMGCAETVQVLLDHGADANADHAMSRVWHGEAGIEVVKTLIAAGADIELKDENGFTPLASHARSHNLPAVEVLIAAGAKIDVDGKPIEEMYDHCDPMTRATFQRQRLHEAAREAMDEVVAEPAPSARRRL
ncbi:ankyrin repeat domain-containing protein [Burkholderia anthina]|uniref:ankyrin repeat domain-containing protein n=1 Tax=Burkholderia anthina TaxID=179879 RepID=UPI0037BECB18